MTRIKGISGKEKERSNEVLDQVIKKVFKEEGVAHHVSKKYHDVIVTEHYSTGSVKPWKANLCI